MGQDVIQIHQTSLTGDASQHPVHESFEGCWGVAQAETEDPKLPQPVFGLASGLRGTCQYPLHRSSEKKPDIKISDSLILGNGYESFVVTLFSGL